MSKMSKITPKFSTSKQKWPTFGLLLSVQNVLEFPKFLDIHFCKSSGYLSKLSKLLTERSTLAATIAAAAIIFVYLYKRWRVRGCQAAKGKVAIRLFKRPNQTHLFNSKIISKQFHFFGFLLWNWCWPIWLFSFLWIWRPCSMVKKQLTKSIRQMEFTKTFLK